MKYVLVIALVLMAWFYWRGQRIGANKADRNTPTPPPTPSAKPIEMVACAHCLVHLARDSAVQGKKDGAHWYCGEAHRRAGELA
jgi:uncharacterized protein